MNDSTIEESPGNWVIKNAATLSLVFYMFSIVCKVFDHPNGIVSSKYTLILFSICSLIFLILGIISALISIYDCEKSGRKFLLKALIGLLLNCLSLIGTISEYHNAGKAIIELQKEKELIKTTQFTVSMPAGYVYVPPRTHSYVKKTPIAARCILIKLNEKIKKNEDLSKLVKNNGNMKMERVSWKNHKISMVRTISGIGQSRTLVFDVIVPIIPKAYQVKLVGNVKHENELRADLKEIMKGIDGPTNW